MPPLALLRRAVPDGLRDSLTDALTDLLLGGRCVGCDRPGRVLCRACEAGLPGRPRPAWPSPTPPGLVTPWAVAPYDGVVRAMVVAHKEHRLLALRDPLGALLARAAAAVAPAHPCCCCRSFPSRERAATWLRPDLRPDRTRGRACARRGRTGSPATAAPPTGSRGPGGAAEEAANLAGSMCCRTAALRRLAAQHPGPRSSCATTSSPPAPPRAAGARSGRSARGRGRYRGRHAPAISGRPGVSARLTFGPRAFVRPNDRLASVHGVRPGPWLSSESVGRCGDKPMPVAGEAVP